MAKSVYSIEEAAYESECSPAWIRRAIREGLLISHKEPVDPASPNGNTKHMINKDDLLAFLDRDNRKSPRREDKRPKWIMYAHPDEVKRIKEVLQHYAEESGDKEIAVVASTIQSNTKRSLP